MFLSTKPFSSHPETSPLVLTAGPVNNTARATTERKGPSPQKPLVCEKVRKRNFENNTCGAHQPSSLFQGTWKALRHMPSRPQLCMHACR